MLLRHLAIKGSKRVLNRLVAAHTFTAAETSCCNKLPEYCDCYIKQLLDETFSPFKK